MTAAFSTNQLAASSSVGKRMNMTAKGVQHRVKAPTMIAIMVVILNMVKVIRLIRLNSGFILHLLCAACSLRNFFSTFVNFLLKVKVPFSNQVLLFFSISLISLISSSLNSWILTLLFSSKLDDVYKCNGR